MSTISGTTINTGITLSTSGTYTSPLTITSTGVVEVASGDAIFGPRTYAWTVANYGTIDATGSSADGVHFGYGGSVTNLSSGVNSAYIGGTRFGIYITGAAGTVTNSGTIGGTGAGGIGVELHYGGSVGNEAGGLIQGGTDGVYVPRFFKGSVTNAGTITGTAGSGVLLFGGGVTNQAGLIQGQQYGVYGYFQSAILSVMNFGTILGTGVSGIGIALRSGGSVSNETGGFIQGEKFGVEAPTVTNSGTITAIGTAGVGVSGLTVINSGTITATGAAGIGLLTSQLSNSGTISGGSGPSGVGVRLGGPGNNAGQIRGYDGIYGGGISAITNSGTILGTGALGFGVELGRGGSVHNATAGLIEGYSGVQSRYAAGTVTNYGTIIGTAGGGVVLHAGGTIVDSGTISGGNGNAVSFGGTGGNLLVLQHGYRLNGGVVGSTSAANTVELDGSVGAAVTVGPGLALTNIQDLLFGAGGNDTLKVANTAGTLPGTISGFSATTDLIDLTAIGTNGTITNNDTANHRLTIAGSGGTLTLQLDASDGSSFTTVSDGASGTDVIPCFCRGTRILAERGEVAVEDLAVGDRVVTLAGAAKPVRWIGMGRDLVTRRNSLARPIIVRAGALADAVPRRDLYLTHGHALYVDGVLIPVEHLVNHRSILWDEAARVVEYYHIELDDHDVVLAEGAPAESYYEAGNRAFFQNTREDSEAGAARTPFAPVLTSGETVERVWAALFERAGGHVERATTGNADLHLVVDGERLDATSVADCVYTFTLAAPPAGPLILSSRSAIPSLVGLNRHEHRRLGVAIRQIILSGPGIMTCLDHDAPLFTAGGCHLSEGGHAWTDGELVLPATLFGHLRGAFSVVVHTRKQAMRYKLAEASARRPDGIRARAG